ncbi:MAG: hypothetical protein ACR2KB_13925 [Chitinophagaceae bacterium]
MIPVAQTKVSVINSKGEHVVNGNCLAACIASLLELPITEVPNVEVFYHFPKEDDFYWDVLEKFLSSKGYELTTNDRFKCFHRELCDLSFGNEEWLADDTISLRGQFYLVTGKSPRGLSHITIWQNGKMVHDPHPTKEGLIELTHFQTLEKLEK